MAKIDSSVLVVRSVTNAMRGQQLLERNGFAASLQRNTAPNMAQGCGYALRITGDVQTAVGILAGAGIPISEIRGG